MSKAAIDIELVLQTESTSTNTDFLFQSPSPVIYNSNHTQPNLILCAITPDEIGTPSAPALVADTLTATSLSLEWEGFRYSNISYLVQWRYEELAGAWQYCRNQSWGPNSTVLVENLQPYTKYRVSNGIRLS